MGHHIDDEGRFQSDKYPELGPDKVVISLRDPKVYWVAATIAEAYRKADPEFAQDVETRMHAIQKERCSDGEHVWAYIECAACKLRLAK